MNVLFEQDLIQNTGLGAEVIASAVQECFKTKEQRHGLPFPLLFLILPLAFHRKTVEVIKNKQFGGLLFKALNEWKGLKIGLQKRMEAMFPRTMDSCSLALASNLIAYDAQSVEFVSTPTCSTSLKRIKHSSTAVDDILRASKRIGNVLASHSLEELSQLLEIVF